MRKIEALQIKVFLKILGENLFDFAHRIFNNYNLTSFFEWNIETIEKASKEIDQMQMIDADLSQNFSENAAKTNRYNFWKMIQTF